MPTPVDLSDDVARQTVVAQGTETVYHGHPTTVRLPGSETILAVWTYNHGGPCGPMKRSDDAGRSWSELLPVPENWSTTKNCPAIYRLTDAAGKARLFVFAGKGIADAMHQSFSEDDGKTWTPMKPNGLLHCVMPFCTIVPIAGARKLLGMTNLRRPGETVEERSNVLAQSISEDGGFTWSPWRIVLDRPGLKMCEPALIRSPAGDELLCLIRENLHGISYAMTTRDEGETWSEAKPLPESLAGDRHQPQYAPDGRLVVCFRDRSKTIGTLHHFIAWVGTYEDLAHGRDGQYRIKLLHSHKGPDCGYSGVEVLPDGTFIATTYLKYRPGPEKNSVVCTRFHLDEIDRLAGC